MRVTYVGNFQPEHSTENHVRRALESLGHEVLTIQEGRGAGPTLIPFDWTELKRRCADSDLFLWTRTGQFDHPDLEVVRRAVKSLDIPSVAYHLDRWWGLNREGTVTKDRHPFFQCDLVCTADGGHDDQWTELGINHRWFPPAILLEEAELGQERPEYKADIGFVGNLIIYGHPEWGPYRRRLYKFLTNRYRRAFKVFPTPGRPAIRGEPLRDLYASVKVLIGDSCLAGDAKRYWSDRIPETTGRGGFLIHPWVEGLTEQHPHLVTYTLGDFNELGAKIDFYVNADEERKLSARLNRYDTLDYHTYQHRMRRMLKEVEQL